jgi:hypothetical protein
MKPSKREIHEQKCPDKYKCKIKYKYCPYNPLELINEKDYDEHIKICKSKPRISEEDKKDMDRAIKLNDINKEKKEISIARRSYYKTYDEEEEIPELDSNLQRNKKKNNKYENKMSGGKREKEANEIVDMIKIENEYESHEIKNFEVDNNFDLDDIKENQIQKIRNKKAKDEQNNRKEKIISKKNYFCKYDPNDEDKEINKYSINIIIPEAIKAILNK